VADEVQVVVQETNTFESKQEPLKLGSWYWYKDEDGTYLCCIISIGSNYVKVKGLYSDSSSGHWTARVHFDKFEEHLTPCLNAQEIITQHQAEYKDNVRLLLEEVKEITARLGVSNSHAIEQKETTGTALIPITGVVDIKKYENELVKVAEKTLPDLFDKIKYNNEMLAHWMLADTLPLLAQCGNLDIIIDKVQDRIFNVKIYAGLAEQVHQFSEGDPADFNDPLHVFENRLYMDEESLIGYDTGGMDCNNIDGFNKWLAKPENRDRILPYPRCLVTFRVRREKKEYEIPRSISDAFAIQARDEANMETYIYLRNGENLYEIGSELDFGDTIFSSASKISSTEPIMFRKDWKEFEFMPLPEYEALCKEDDFYKARIKQEEKERLAYKKARRRPPKQRTKKEKDAWREWKREYEHKAPHGGYFHSRDEYREGSSQFRNRSDYRQLNQDSVYYDDAMAYLNKEIARYNRLALIIQGIFDRSEILHPHPPVKVWDNESFNRSVKLVYDASANLYQGERPDIEAYMETNRKGFSSGSVFYGQQDYWLRKNAEKYMDLYPDSYHRTTYSDYGDNGPTEVAQPLQWSKRKQTAAFSWLRERRRYNYYRDDLIRVTCKVPASYLFDLAQYKRGDYKTFLKDPRTRSEYMKWAPQLIMGEMYLDGKLEVAMPVQTQRS